MCVRSDFQVLICPTKQYITCLRNYFVQQTERFVPISQFTLCYNVYIYTQTSIYDNIY